MRYRKLGRTGFEVSEIGFGSWGIGGGWGRQDDTEALAALRRAHERGVNFYDTALVYGEGHSEQLLRKFLKGIRDEVFVASKIPPKTYRWPVLEEHALRDTFPADWIVQCTERSLKNLGTDYLDVQQLHAWTDAYTAQDEWLAAAQRLKKEGKIRAFGVSANDWDPVGPVNAVKAGLLDTVQVIYNIFEQRPRAELLPAALESQTGIIVRVPFEEGLLTGRIVPGHVFEPNDWRREWLTPERIAEAASRVEKLRNFLSPRRPSLANLALKFCLSHPAVSTVIPGMRRTQHVEENTAASDGDLLDRSELEALEEHAFVHGWKYPWS